VKIRDHSSAAAIGRKPPRPCCIRRVEAHPSLSRTDSQQRDVLYVCAITGAELHISDCVSGEVISMTHCGPPGTQKGALQCRAALRVYEKLGEVSILCGDCARKPHEGSLSNFWQSMVPWSKVNLEPSHVQ
jgi:hypothetical protein